MEVKHKLLDGHHYVRAVGYAHLFAQWPCGTRCDHSSVSAGEMPPSVATVERFIDAAQRAADQERVNECTSSDEV